MAWRIPQWVFDAYPWLHDVISYLSLLEGLWSEYQNLAVLAGLALVWRGLRRERMRLSERVDTLAQIVRATRDEAEAALGQADAPLLPPASSQVTRAGRSVPPTSPQGSGALEANGDVKNWEVIRLGWRDVRDRLELAIEAIGRAHVRNKYSRIPRYRYRDVITALEKDRVLKPQVADHLRRMDLTFNILKFRPHSVTAADVAEFNAALATVDGALPRLPDENTAQDDAAPGCPQPA